MKKKTSKYIEKFPDNDKVLGYLSGLVASDGTLPKRFKSLICIGLNIADKETIDFFIKQTLVNCDDYRPHTRERGESRIYCANLYIPKFRLFLEQLGLTPNKSKTLSINLSQQSETFIWYFIRGFFDGDGTVNQDEKLVNCSIRFVSASYQFILTLQSYIGGFISKHSSKEAWYLQFKSHSAKQLAEALPKDSFTMERKTNKLLHVSKLDNAKKRNKTGLIGILWNKFIPNKSILDLYNESSLAIRYESLIQRIGRGLSLEEALSLEKQSPHCFEFHGEYRTLPDLVAKYGKVPYSATWMRLKKGWDLEKALLTPNLRPKALT